ncbi:hypothetical protein T484DRAFT_1940878, partial [Baffinella frigidus]
QTDKAMEHVDKALERVRAGLVEQTLIAGQLHNIKAMVCDDQEDLEGNVASSLEALAAGDGMPDSDPGKNGLRLTVLRNLVSCHERMQDYPKAIQYAERARDIVLSPAWPLSEKNVKDAWYNLGHMRMHVASSMESDEGRHDVMTQAISELVKGVGFYNDEVGIAYFNICQDNNISGAAQKDALRKAFDIFSTTRTDDRLTAACKLGLEQGLPAMQLWWQSEETQSETYRTNVQEATPRSQDPAACAAWRQEDAAARLEGGRGSTWSASTCGLGSRKCPCGTTENLKACMGCKIEAYCSPECQKKAWPDHKDACKAAKAARNA